MTRDWLGSWEIVRTTFGCDPGKLTLAGFVARLGEAGRIHKLLNPDPPPTPEPGTSPAVAQMLAAQHAQHRQMEAGLVAAARADEIRKRFPAVFPPDEDPDATPGDE